MDKRNYEAELPLTEIKAWIFQREQINTDKLSETTEDIKQRGVVEPILVRRTKKGFEGIAGYLRFIASQKADLKTIPAMIYETIEDLDATDLLMIENLHRQELSDIDEANILNRYITDHKLKQKDIAKRINCSESYVSLKLKLLDDKAPLREAISNGTITEQKARMIRALPTEKAMTEAIKLVEGKTVKETRTLVSDTLGKYRKEELQAQINELQAKIKAIDGFEKERDKLQNSIDKLKGTLTALKTDDKEINRNIKKITELERRYFPAIEEITKLTSQINGLKKTFPKKPQEHISTLEKERKTIYSAQAKVKVKIDTLNEQLKELRKTHKDYKEEASTLTQQINQLKSTEKQLSEMVTRKTNLKEVASGYEKSHKNAIKDFNNLKAQVEAENKDILTKRTEIANKIATNSQAKMVLNGRIANRKNYLEAKNVLTRKLKSFKNN